MASARIFEERVVFMAKGEDGRAVDVPSFWLFAPAACELLAWVGLPEEAPAEHDARALAARCRRRLWPLATSEDRTLLWHRTRMLLVLAEAAGDGVIVVS